jgi:hypothetical protein
MKRVIGISIGLVGGGLAVFACGSDASVPADTAPPPNSHTLALAMDAGATDASPAKCCLYNQNLGQCDGLDYCNTRLNQPKFSRCIDMTDGGACPAAGGIFWGDCSDPDSGDACKIEKLETRFSSPCATIRACNGGYAP